MKYKKELVQVDSKGRVTLPIWAWTQLLKESGSKAITVGGQRRAVKALFIKKLRACINENDNKY